MLTDAEFQTYLREHFAELTPEAQVQILRAAIADIEAAQAQARTPCTDPEMEFFRQAFAQLQRGENPELPPKPIKQLNQ